MKQFTTPPQHQSCPDENATDMLLGRLRSHPSVPIYELVRTTAGTAAERPTSSTRSRPWRG